MTGETDAAEATAMPFTEAIAQITARRPRILAIFGTIMAAALMIAALLPPRFYATATLAVLPAPEFTVRQDAGSHVLSTSALAMDQVMKAETEILQSDDLHEAALRSVGMLNIYPDIDPASAGIATRVVRRILHGALSPWIAFPADMPAVEIERALHRFDGDLLVLPTKDANVIEVTFHHRDGALAAKIVNTLLSEYAKRRERLYDDPQLAVVRRQTEQFTEAVNEADAAFSDFKKRHRISDYTAERDLLVRRQSATWQALADADAWAAEQHARLAALSHEIAKNPANVSLYQENDTDTRLQAIDASLLDLRAQVAAANLHYRPTSHRVADLMTQLAAREAEHHLLERNPAPSMARVGRSLATDSLLLDRARAATDESAAAARAISLRTELRNLTASLADLTSQETSLTDLQRRKNAADAAFANASQVLAEQRMTEAEDALRLANVRVIQPARAPLHPAPIPMFIVLAGALLGALATSLWCIADILIRPTLLTTDGLAHATGLPVLGVFPRQANPNGEYMPM